MGNSESRIGASSKISHARVLWEHNFCRTWEAGSMKLDDVTRNLSWTPFGEANERRTMRKVVLSGTAGSVEDACIQTSQKIRELHLARAVAVEDIERECRERRTNKPCAPHQPRPTFKKIETRAPGGRQPRF